METNFTAGRALPPDFTNFTKDAVPAMALQNPTVDWPADDASRAMRDELVSRRDAVLAYISQAEARLAEAVLVRSALLAAIDTLDSSDLLHPAPAQRG